MTYKLTALSLGAGVQSSTLLLMACRGDLPRPDLAIFADTGWETQATYNHLAWLKDQAERAGIPLVTVSWGNLKEDMTDGAFIRVPFHCVNQYGQRGRAARQCTTNYKVRPIKQELRRFLGLPTKARLPQGSIEIWLGISTDESHRCLSSQAKYITNTFPLLTTRPMSRADCIDWLAQNYGITVPKSACIGCPFHKNTEWSAIRANPAEWAEAIEMDESIRYRPARDGFPHQGRFLHYSCRPLADLDLRSPQEKGQIELPGFLNPGVERAQIFANMEI